MGTAKKSPLLELMRERFGPGVNVYDVTTAAAEDGSEDAAEMLKTLHRAMELTDVQDTQEARRAVGDFVLRMSFVMAEQGGPISLEIGEGWEGLHSYIDTDQCYVNRAG